MLDAFGKGASDDIRAAKNELYGQMTWDPVTSQSLNAPPQITTPPPQPAPVPQAGVPALRHLRLQLRRWSLKANNAHTCMSRLVFSGKQGFANAVPDRYRQGTLECQDSPCI